MQSPNGNLILDGANGKITAKDAEIEGTLVAKDIKGSNLIALSHVVKVTIKGSTVTTTNIKGGTPVFGVDVPIGGWRLVTLGGEKCVAPPYGSYDFSRLYPIVFGSPNMTDSKHLYVSVLKDYQAGFPWAFSISDDSTWNDGSFYVLWVALPK